MNEIKMGLSPNVLMCAAAGFILGLILGLWTGEGFGVVFAAVVVMTILAAIAGMFI